MRCHESTIVHRMMRAGLRVNLRYRVVAVGIDDRNRMINIKTNAPRLVTRGLHAEERVLFTSPKSLRKILIARFSAEGKFLPIDPCHVCLRLAKRYGVEIQPILTRAEIGGH